MFIITNIYTIYDSPLKSLKNEKRPKIALGNQQVIAV